MSRACRSGGHALEIPFVFDTLGHETEALWGTDPPKVLMNPKRARLLCFCLDLGSPLKETAPVDPHQKDDEGKPGNLQCDRTPAGDTRSECHWSATLAALTHST